MTADASGAMEGGAVESTDRAWTPRALSDLRSRRDRRLVALAVAGVVGVAAVYVHWLGLFVAGVLVGLVSESLPKALAAGLAVGVLVLVVHVLASPVMGPAEFVALAPASYVTIGAALVGPVWGSLVRGVI